VPPLFGSIHAETAEFQISQRPDRLIMIVPRLSPNRARRCANDALREARKLMPKMSGRAASRMFPLYARGYFGIGWQDNYVWFQEHGIGAFTMNRLAGKTIPMWVDDPYGTERESNPRAQTRVTLSGKVQVLIFRKAANIGDTKTVRTKVAGQWVKRTVPASYPGAPGRIGKREAGRPQTTTGRRPGAIAPGNVGVRWRHPGLAPRLFLNHAITSAAQQNGILPIRIYIADRGWRSHF
jgi:hypothetical protein